MSIPLKTCDFPNCHNQFPEHYFASYCGIHPKRDIVLHRMTEERWPEEQYDVETLVDALLSADYAGLPLDFAFVEETAALLAAKAIERRGGLVPEDRVTWFERQPECENKKVRAVVQRSIDLCRRL